MPSPGNRQTGVNKHRVWLPAFGILVLLPCLLLVVIPLPNPLFTDPCCTVLKDRNGQLLGAHIAADEQWRFPPLKVLPERFKQCIILFEDAAFFHHPGIDPGALARALYLNLKNNRIVSGGSTLTMQVIRLARKGKPRTYGEKIIEGLLAFKLELRYTKEEILALYGSHAPFGGNTVGLEAATWRYFSREPDNISWAEAALLAVLPNNPSLLYPGRSHVQLRQKRDLLLAKLQSKGFLTADEWELAVAEPLPGAPQPLPQPASHLLIRVLQEGWQGKTAVTSLDLTLQQHTTSVIRQHYQVLSAARIHNAAAIVIKTATGETLAYAGNTQPPAGESHGNAVDIITAERSTGSLLKPFLYACLLDEGLLLPGQLVADIPMIFRDFSPRNFNLEFQGAIPADQALARSLNIPFVSLLQDYNYRKFYFRLGQLGMQLPQPADYYALAMIIGGAEASLWTMTAMYAGLARVLINSDPSAPVPSPGQAFFPNTYLQVDPATQPSVQQMGRSGTQAVLGAAAVWFTFKAMREVIRPDERQQWQRFSSTRQVAWKTGTSYGNRDAWAIGITPEYVVGVWVGNADGEGRPEIRGSRIAGPILFDIFDALPETGWFTKPVTQIETARLCKQSGMLASPVCPEQIDSEIPLRGIQGQPCPYHKLVHLDAAEQYQVDSNSYPVSRMKHVSWFVLPPVQEFYYKSRNSSYQPLPPALNQQGAVMEFIYPARKATRIYIPVELDGQPGSTVFELAHRKPASLVYWHLDGNYIGLTKEIHQLDLCPAPGSHLLDVIDEQGNHLQQQFEVLPRVMSKDS